MNVAHPVFPSLIRIDWSNDARKILQHGIHPSNVFGIISMYLYTVSGGDFLHLISYHVHMQQRFLESKGASRRV